MNREQIRDMARKSLGETTASFWTDAELNLYFNTAGHDIADKTKCFKTNAYVTVVEDQSDYTITSSLTNPLSIQEVYHKRGGTQWWKLEPRNRATLDNNDSGWMNVDSGTPTDYVENIEEDVLTLYPPPDSTNSGSNYLRVFYSQDFTEVTSDSASPDLPIDLQLAIVDFITAYGFQQRGWGDKANDSWNKYFTRLKEYMIERGREKEDYDIVSRPYRR